MNDDDFAFISGLIPANPLTGQRRTQPHKSSTYKKETSDAMTESQVVIEVRNLNAVIAERDQLRKKVKELSAEPNDVVRENLRIDRDKFKRLYSQLQDEREKLKTPSDDGTQEEQIIALRLQVNDRDAYIANLEKSLKSSEAREDFAKNLYKESHTELVMLKSWVAQCPVPDVAIRSYSWDDLAAERDHYKSECEKLQKENDKLVMTRHGALLETLDLVDNIKAQNAVSEFNKRQEKGTKQ